MITEYQYKAVLLFSSLVSYPAMKLSHGSSYRAEHVFFPLDRDGGGEARGHPDRGGQEEDLPEGLQGPHREEQVRLEFFGL